MKTNSVMELLKAKGIRVKEKTDAGSVEKTSLRVPGSRKKRLYHVSQESEVQTEPKVSPTETDSKRIANRQQTDSKQVIETDSKRIANRQQGKSQASETGSTTDSRDLSNRQQTDSKQVAKGAFFESLVGHERNLLLLIFRECLRIASLVSPELTLAYISEVLKCTPGTAKSAVGRLVEKGFVSRASSKTGRGGWIKFGISKELYQDLRIRETDSKQVAIRQQTDSKQVAQQVAQRIAEPSSSSRDLLLNKESTTTQLGAELSTLDLSRVQPFGITLSVITRCVELYPLLRPEQLEVLVFRFAEFTKDPKNKVQNARGFFISLAEQASKGQVPLDHIETPDERLMRLFIEQQKEAKARRIDVERAAQDVACETWLETLTLEMKLTLIPETSILKAGSAPHTAMLKNHFVENVWPQRRAKILEQEVVKE